jgi:hypothetical protein
MLDAWAVAPKGNSHLALETMFSSRPLLPLGVNFGGHDRVRLSVGELWGDRWGFGEGLGGWMELCGENS